MSAATKIAIHWIGVICSIALVVSLVTIIVNAFSTKDPNVITAALTVAAIGGTGVGVLGGFIGGYHMGKAAISTDGGTPHVAEAPNG
jgi:hypothetical protein